MTAISSADQPPTPEARDTGPSQVVEPGTPGADQPGLTSKQAEHLLALHGPNTLRRPRTHPLWRRILSALSEPLVVVLLVAAVLTTVTGDLPDTVVIALVVVANTFVAVWQERRAERAVSALTQLAAPLTRVVRDGHERLLPAADVVPGDLVVLGEGDIVPADGFVVQAIALGIDESSLTGESVPVDKAVSPRRRVAVHPPDTPGENLVFAGTTVVHGRGRVLVTETGAHSALGRIAELLQVPRVATPLQRRMGQLSMTLAVVVVALCAVVLAVGLLQGQPLELMLLTGISLAVAAVPESMPVVVTMSLALAARRMARRRAIVRSLASVETLGSITLLATDKTGTLTEGRMSVAEVVCAPGVERAELLRAGALCNDARLAHDAASAHMGDPTEVALLDAARAGGIERRALERDTPRVAERPFDSVTKRMSTEHQLPDGRRLTITKGSPEGLLGAGRLASGSAPSEALRRSQALAAEGRRVLAFVQTTSGEAPKFLGLIALADPPRPAARQTIDACRRAGIRPVLITGDHLATATAVAGAVGIEGGTALDLSELNGSVASVTDRQVLARATPEQKLQVVAAWQAQGEVVAMTGDGVNDGPALRRADIGVAMGDRGTEVARQAADLVLADDELGTVVAAVEEGRRVYANIRRFLLYALSGGAAEILVMLGGPLVGLTLPLLPAQILWVNLLTHSLAGTALGAEPIEKGSMDRPPRNPAEGVLGGGLGWRVVAVGLGLAAVSLLAGQVVGGPEVTQRSTVLLALGAGQLGVALGVGVAHRRRTEANPALPLTVAAAAVLLAAAVVAPPLQALLTTHLVPLTGWLAALATAGLGWVAARTITSTTR